ncbi:MAG TPA: YciI family protein [Opitutaceae bacterium]|nr:YciI family protein [Opitutaceae bacterium]
MNYFVLKLLPPRPTFASDMTTAERALMGQHRQYWSTLMQAGKVAIFGPVADPNGMYGIGIASFADSQEATAFANNDPVVLANAGFQYHIAPMAAAVLPGML